MRAYSAGWRLAMVGALAAVVVAIGALLGSAYYALSLPGERAAGLGAFGIGFAALVAIFAALAWLDSGRSA